MRCALATVLLLAAPLAAELPTTALDAVAAGLTIANWEDCKANDLVFEEDGKLWCRRPIEFGAALDLTTENTADAWSWCREPECYIGLANTNIDWPEDIESLRQPPAPLFDDLVGHKTGLLLRLDGTWQLIVNGAPYTCTPEERK